MHVVEMLRKILVEGNLAASLERCWLIKAHNGILDRVKDYKCKCSLSCMPARCMKKHNEESRLH